MMPLVQELKKAYKALDTQIAEVEQEECEAEEAQLWAKEEARVAVEQARRAEEEECGWEQVHLAEEARVQAEEEVWACKEAHSEAEPQGGRGVFQEEGSTAMSVLVIVGVRRKSRGGGEGGQPTQKQGQELGTGSGVGPWGGHRGHM